MIHTTLPALLLSAASLVHAANINISGYENAEMQKSVIGTWASNEKVSIQNPGLYSLSLTDFGLTNPNFGNSFSHLGAMLSNGSTNIASVTFDKNTMNPTNVFNFEITGGDYWLSLFAITDSSNAGTFNLRLLDNNPAPVPLPAAFWLMAASLFGLFSCRKKAAKQC
jgi:hypothetical protein